MEHPDTSQRSDIFEVQECDDEISVGISFETVVGPKPVILGSNDEYYPDEPQVLARLQPDQLVLGGFHSYDCVSRFESAAQRLRIPVGIDVLLTEQFFFRVISTFHEDLNAKMIANGSLDPVMHEDDPLEEKLLLMDHRLDDYLNTLHQTT